MMHTRCSTQTMRPDVYTFENGRLKSTTRDGLSDVPVDNSAVAPTWHLAASSDQSCDAVCFDQGKTCDSDSLSFNTNDPNNQEYMNAAAKSAGISCDYIQGNSWGGNTGGD